MPSPISSPESHTQRHYRGHTEDIGKYVISFYMGGDFLLCVMLVSQFVYYILL
jgi:hypothetical protein